jgi:hypothetical protein
MPQKKQTPEQRLIELEESLELMDTADLPELNEEQLRVGEDDPEGMDEFWEEQLTEMMRMEKRRPASEQGTNPDKGH